MTSTTNPTSVLMARLDGDDLLLSSWASTSHSFIWLIPTSLVNLEISLYAPPPSLWYPFPSLPREKKVISRSVRKGLFQSSAFFNISLLLMWGLKWWGRVIFPLVNRVLGLRTNLSNTAEYNYSDFLFVGGRAYFANWEICQSFFFLIYFKIWFYGDQTNIEG